MISQHFFHIPKRMLNSIRSQNYTTWMNWRISTIAIMFYFSNQENMDKICICGYQKRPMDLPWNCIYKTVCLLRCYFNSSAYNVCCAQGLYSHSNELNLSGNCLKGSRPLLSFNKSSDDTPSSRLMKEMLIHVRFYVIRLTVGIRCTTKVFY